MKTEELKTENPVQDEQEVQQPVAADGGTQDKPNDTILHPDQGKELVNYVYADTVISCGICGKDTHIVHPKYQNVQTGLQLPFLPANNDAIMGLACEHCRSNLTFRFIEALTPPAYEFSHKGFENPTEFDLTWIGGKNAKVFKVYVETLTNEESNGDNFELYDSVDTPLSKMVIPENTSIRVRIDSIYDDLAEVVIGSDIVFISTEAYPQEDETTDTPQTEMAQPQTEESPE